MRVLKVVTNCETWYKSAEVSHLEVGKLFSER